ncbi:hypothetical protein [Pseudomonas putida]|uniref:hypothetical protein n=1 Tax=Pseudomonas putida TaxID=303 RepID=UPI002B2551B5|nr:hypothetical protein [Pseudomonas putida]
MLPNPQYFANKWDEEGKGVKLFSTPRRGNNCGGQYGTWFSVSKLYGNPALPFRVQAAEYVPWGIEIDLADVGDFGTLGQALDAVFWAHENGCVELAVIVENEDLGRYVQGESKIPAVAVHGQSHEARALDDSITALIQRHQAEVSARARRFAEAVPFTDIPELLAQIRARVKACEIDDSTNVRLHLAASIKAHILSGTGVLIEVVNNDLKHHHLAIDATTLVKVRQGEADAYVDVNGVYHTQDAANASISKVFTELYNPHLTPNPRGKPFSVCWFHETPWEVYLDENTFRPMENEPALSEGPILNWVLTEEQELDRIVASAAEAYKLRRERLHQQQNPGSSEC